MKRLVFVSMTLLCSGAALAQSPAPAPKAPAPLASAPKEITPPIERTIPLQIGETRVFQFGESVIRVDISKENIVDAKADENRSAPGRAAFAFKGLAMGNVIVTARSEDGGEVHRLRFVVGGHQVKIYNRYEPDFFSLNCDEFSCGPGVTSKRQPNSVTTRTPTGGGGFVDRTYQ